VFDDNNKIMGTTRKENHFDGKKNHIKLGLYIDISIKISNQECNPWKYGLFYLVFQY